MNFSDASKVQAVIQSCDQIEVTRGKNRAKINAAANGMPPVDPSTAQKMGLKVNFNDGSMAVLMQQGRRQYGNAFMSRRTFFKVKLPDAPEKTKLDWETWITRGINRVMKKSRAYFDMSRYKWASVLAHGIAPTIWYDDDCWLQQYIALEDFRVPGGTECSMEDMPWFAVREGYTEGKLARKAFGDNASEGWNKPVVQTILDNLHGTNTEAGQNYWMTAPEKAMELIKQNGGYFTSDSVPKIFLWHFFFYDDTNPKDCKWKMRVVVDATTSSAVSTNQTDFLFDDGDTAFAGDLSQILHVQFGDLNNVAPFKIHSVRSLGFLLMEPCYWDNIVTCRLTQHVMENMNSWLRFANPTGRDRAQVVELMNQGILKEGVSIVPQNERHQINTQNVEMVQSRMSALKDQASVTYTQDTQGQNSPDETATAVMARVSSVNAMMSGLLSTAFNYENFAYAEICRRFTRENTQDKDCRAFQDDMKAKGIPPEWLDSERWETEPEIPIGNGNPTMEMVKVNQLMANRAAFSPTGQQWILHQFATTLTDDPNAAETLAPINSVMQMTNSEEYGEIAFSVLMQGVPVRGRDDLNAQEQADVLIGLMAGKIANIEQTTNVATPDQMAGLQMVGQYIASLIARLQQDPMQVAVAKDLADKLGKLMNTVKAFQQRAALAAQSNQENGNGEAAAKVQGFQMMNQAKLQADAAKNAQKIHQKEAGFILDQHRKNDAAVAESERQKLRTASEISTNTLKAAAEPPPKAPAKQSD